MPDVIYIEPCNFEDSPTGGQLSFAKQMIHVFGPRLALVGISTDEAPVGRWIKRAFNGRVCDFFSIGRRKKTAQAPLIPARAKAYCGIVRYRKQILSSGIRSVFISAPEVLLASYKWGWNDLCFLFPGVDSPLRMSRYRWAEPFAGVFDSFFLSALRYANLLLAAADESTIRAFAARAGSKMQQRTITSFPTRVDTDIFHPADQAEVREELGIPRDVPVFATVGRLNYRKGWDLLIDAFRLLATSRMDAHFYFVGDGEDRPKVELKLQEYGLSKLVQITGYVNPQGVAAYLNAADVFVLGSHFEGWPTVMVEAIATGSAVVSTAVSAAAELVENGKNGYIVHSRDPRLFCEAMVKALSLDARSCSLAKSRRYAVSGLAEELGKLWAPLRN
ncbi:MAG: glycosyltransferase family 4 protein [Planctomycetes bacterium]|nr:glycosyltransferase family 4 protein [Planctomycetota bacterium]